MQMQKMCMVNDWMVFIKSEKSKMGFPIERLQVLDMSAYGGKKINGIIEFVNWRFS